MKHDSLSGEVPLLNVGLNRWMAGAILAVIAFAVYANTFSVPLLLDDTATIGTNPSIKSLWPPQSVLAPPHTIPSSGRPWLNLSFALNYAFGGTAVEGYHAVNLVIHILAGLVLFEIVRRTLLQAALRKTFGVAADWLALAVAVLWLLHPLQTNSVTYLSQRAESLMGLCYLATLYCFIRGSSSVRSRGWFWLAVVCCTMGMGTKEVMVSAPVTVWLYDRTFVSGTFRAAWRRHGYFHVGLAATWMVLGYLAVVSRLQERGVGFQGGYTWWTYARTECVVVIQYLKLAIWPNPLVFDYGVDGLSSTAAATVLCMASVGLLLAGTLLALRNWPAGGFLAAWFFLILSPTSTVIPVAGQPMAENRMYLALVAVVTALTIGAWVAGRTKGLIALLVMGGFFCGITNRRNADYRTDVAIWSDTVHKRPESSRAHHNLGEAFRARGSWQDATAQFEEALRISPNYVEAHNNLGNALSKLPGRLPDALRCYEKALQLRPDYAEAHNNLGTVLLQTPGRLGDAITHLERALELGFDRAGVHFNLGLALLNAPGRVEAAIDQYEKGLLLDPENFDAQDNLGIVLSGIPGRLPDAIRRYDKALRIRPDNAMVRNNLANALVLVPGKEHEAIAHYRTALQLNPSYVEAHYNLGSALLRIPGQEREAADHFKAALQLRPDLEQARAALLEISQRAGDSSLK